MRSLLVILAFVISSTAAAFPSRNVANCDACHDDTSNTGVVSSPSDISLGIGDSGSVVFDLVIPSGATAAIRLVDIDATGLDATIDTTSFFWEFWDDTGPRATDPVTPFYATEPNLTGTTTYQLDFSIGSGATLGDYVIDVIVAFSGARSDITDNNFTVSVVPIPAAVWLFGSGLLGLVGVTRMRRNKA